MHEQVQAQRTLTSDHASWKHPQNQNWRPFPNHLPPASPLRGGGQGNAHACAHVHRVRDKRISVQSVICVSLLSSLTSQTLKVQTGRKRSWSHSGANIFRVKVWREAVNCHGDTSELPAAASLPQEVAQTTSVVQNSKSISSERLVNAPQSSFKPLRSRFCLPVNPGLIRRAHAPLHLQGCPGASRMLGGAAGCGDL